MKSPDFISPHIVTGGEPPQRLRWLLKLWHALGAYKVLWLGIGLGVAILVGGIVLYTNLSKTKPVTESPTTIESSGEQLTAAPTKEQSKTETPSNASQKTSKSGEGTSTSDNTSSRDSGGGSAGSSSGGGTGSDGGSGGGDTGGGTGGGDSGGGETGGSSGGSSSGCSGRPNASCTGVPSGTVLSSWTGGPNSSSASNVTYDGVNIPAPSGDDHWTFSGNNVTIRNSKITGAVWFLGNNLTIEHSEIVGGVSLSGTGTVSMTYNNIHDWDDGIHITSDSGPVTDVTISYNYVHDPDPPCGAHADVIQLLGVNGLIVTHNNLDMGPWFQVCGQDVLNGVFQIESTQGPDTNMTISDNYLNGGGYTARFYACSNTSFTNNRFGRDYHYGPVDNQDNSCFTNKSGNVWDDTGQSITF